MTKNGEAAAVAGGHRGAGELGADGVAVRLEGVLAARRLEEHAQRPVAQGLKQHLAGLAHARRVHPGDHA